MRFDTAGFVTAVASRNSKNIIAGSKSSGNPNFLGGGGGSDGEGGAAASAFGPSGASHPGGSDGTGVSGGGGRNTSGGSGSAAGEDGPAPVVIGAAGDDGSSAAGGGEGGHLWGVPGKRWGSCVCVCVHECVCFFFGGGEGCDFLEAGFGGGCLLLLRVPWIDAAEALPYTDSDSRGVGNGATTYHPPRGVSSASSGGRDFFCWRHVQRPSFAVII